uniref:Putative secreted protein n=1 Tax=Anopheles darlingi TaxID=43151 RepID=A0A2M4D4U8_ANODA
MWQRGCGLFFFSWQPHCGRSVWSDDDDDDDGNGGLVTPRGCRVGCSTFQFNIHFTSTARTRLLRLRL